MKVKAPGVRSRKFRLGLKVASGYCVGIRIREAKTEAFAVKDHRGELYKKHYPPALHDEVWRLDRIAKDGALHKKLMKSEVITVEDFLRVLARDPQRLRNDVGKYSGACQDLCFRRKAVCILCRFISHHWRYLQPHLRVPDVLIADVNSFIESLSLSVDSLVKRAYENWNRVIEYDGKVLSALTFPSPPAHNTIEYPFINSDPNVSVSTSSHTDYGSNEPSFDGSADWSDPQGNGFGDSFSEEVRLRSSEMLETDDMQKLLRSFVGPVYAQGPGRSSGKTVVGWLKLKAALRWGILRKKAAERRAQLVELD
ncbi:calmodulin-binding protein 60 E-like protein [Tanacetum coccineum]